MRNPAFNRFLLALLILSLNPLSVCHARLKTGTVAPAFELQSLDGKKISLKTLTGKGHVMLIFWEPECVYCYMHVKEFNALHEQYHNKGLSIAAINFLGEHPDEVREYVNTNKLKYLMLADQLGNIDVAQKYKVFGSPTIVIISPENKVLFYGHKMPDIKQWVR